jgi:hypothetical protein
MNDAKHSRISRTSKASTKRAEPKTPTLKCPECHSERVVRIAYGLPAEELMEEAARGRANTRRMQHRCG